MQDILSEIVPLSPSDCFYIVDRRKSGFDYPIHKHREFELNMVQGASGAVRIVGDSVETLGDIDLVLVGPNLEHAWSQGECTNSNIHEITIQFDASLFPESILSKNQFISVSKMLKEAEKGISFPTETILKAYGIMDSLLENKNSFEQFQKMMSVLFTLSLSEFKVLASSSFTNTNKSDESRRIQKVADFINANYTRVIKLEEVASEAGMSAGAFCRFFKERTGKTLTSYIMDVRLGAASRMLIDTSLSISEISYATGFNNLSNFNRLFMKNKGMTPRDFRQMYKKHKFIV